MLLKIKEDLVSSLFLLKSLPSQQDEMIININRLLDDIQEKLDACSRK